MTTALHLSSLRDEAEQQLNRLVNTMAEIRAAVEGECGPPDGEMLRIMSVAADFFGVTVSQLAGKSRPMRITWPRQCAMAYAWETGRWTCTAIGDAFGGKDHGTVLYAADRVKERCELYPQDRQQYSAFVEAVKKGVEK